MQLEMGNYVLPKSVIELWEMKIAIVVKVERKITVHKISLITSDFLLARYLWLTMVRSQTLVLHWLDLSPSSAMVSSVTLGDFSKVVTQTVTLTD